MSDLSRFPIAQRWPAQHPDRIQLYSLNTPNGVKASIMLEETGLPYEPHLVDITRNESHTPEFLSLNPNGKIPAIIDPDGPRREPPAGKADQLGARQAQINELSRRCAVRWAKAQRATAAAVSGRRRSSSRSR